MAGFKRLFKRGKDTERGMSSVRHQLVATLDFEEKHTGYALFFRDDPVKTQNNQEQNPENEEFISVKLPTYMLLTPNKNFDSFGYEAKSRYADLTKKDKHRGWMLFRGFNMLLQNKGLTRGLTVKDIKGKSMPAMEIFSMSLGYLRDHMLQELRNQKVGGKEIDIQYEITVLASWNDNAKEFIMDTAVQAGLDSQRVKFYLDVPDSACQNKAWDLGESATKGAISSSSHPIVALAFDFGTTFSGYAFSFRDTPMEIKTNTGWHAGRESLTSLKTPTCVLLTPNKQFYSFGFEAENKYAELVEDDEHDGWMLFRRFKMMLHHNEGLTRKSTVKDINGKSMRAMEIFSMSIGFFRDHFLQTLNMQKVGVQKTDIQYVITVPAIWNDNAKQFMREAAVEAGLDLQRVKLSLEPEAASIWCQTVDTDVTSLLSDSGCQYMVVDLGGDTADISVLEINMDGTLKKIHKASGGPWGGTAVDRNYFDLLTKVFGQTTMNRFEKEDMVGYFDLQRQFEIKKRSFTHDAQGKVTIRVPSLLIKIYNEIGGTYIRSNVDDMGLGDLVTFTGDKLRLDVSVVRGWFEVPMQHTINHVKHLLREEKTKKVNKILLVGGFGECKIVQEMLRNQLHNKIIIVPYEAGLAVLKGAVRYGHMPEIQSSTKGTKSPSSYLIVAAFDFGTTFSGYAFSFRGKPMKIHTNAVWNAGSESLMSLKTPTCVLLTKNMQFDSFGFEAENKYAELAEENKHNGWMLFRRFKMFLHNNEGLTRESTVEDINGKSMRAMEIFSMSIGCLRDHLLHTLNMQKECVKETDIQYVITVPAIWNDNAKQFMREAAVEAGFDSQQVKLSLEPEAASIWCQTVDTDVTNSLSDRGCQYMVVDLGGGTADISVHEKKVDGTLKEIHKASGGPWGGTAVDKNFFDWLTKLLGQTTMDRFKAKQMIDYFDLQRNFETKKRSITHATEGKVTFRLTASLQGIYNEIEGTDLTRKIDDMGLSDMVTFIGDKLRLDASIVRSWFEKPIQQTIKHVKKLLRGENTKNVNKILLVGGFGECKIVQEEFRNQLPNKTLIVPDEAGLAVLKGAVRFGQMPEIISSRIMKFTYGVEIMRKYDEKRHSQSDIIFNDERDPLIGHVFRKFVTIGEEIPLHHEVTKRLTPTSLHSAVIPVYYTTDPNPEFTTDRGCNVLGNLEFIFPDGQTLKDNKLDVTLSFGDTELSVRAKIIRNGHEFYTRFNCLK